MGKHAAAEGASDPIVAAALASRHGDGGAAHAAQPAGAEHPVGWPAPPAPGGGGLGWPADPAGAAESTAVTQPRSAWRRFFGARRVA